MYPLEGQAQPAILIHSPRTGRDVATSCRAAVSGENFNLLSPHGKRLSARCQAFPQTHFNFLSPYGKRPRAGGDRAVPPHISIPSPRMGIDEAIHATPVGRGPISIHSSHTGRDGVRWCWALNYLLFQSPLPAREETGISFASNSKPLNFNPLSPHGERRPFPASTRHNGYFNPLSPHGERLWSTSLSCIPAGHFNPLFPYGKRRAAWEAVSSATGFQSTLPIREETACQISPIAI